MCHGRMVWIAVSGGLLSAEVHKDVAHKDSGYLCALSCAVGMGVVPMPHILFYIFSYIDMLWREVECVVCVHGCRQVES